MLDGITKVLFQTRLTPFLTFIVISNDFLEIIFN